MQDIKVFLFITLFFFSLLGLGALVETNRTYETKQLLNAGYRYILLIPKRPNHYNSYDRYIPLKEYPKVTNNCVYYNNTTYCGNFSVSAIVEYTPSWQTKD
jgi:hypothetical protein